jgi:hypothetical protein
MKKKVLYTLLFFFIYTPIKNTQQKEKTWQMRQDYAKKIIKLLTKTI